MRTLVEQAASVASGEVSPVELTERALAEAERVQPELNAFTTILAERAMASARDLEGVEAPGPLHGVPIALKDLYDVAGVATTGCCAAYHDRTATSDSAVTQTLERAGAVIVAKTNMHELAFGATTQVSSFGPCFNPWGKGSQRIPGGSSGGSGAAVAAGVVTMAMGSDTGGSVRIPSSLCGVTGLKPTHGAVSLRGAMPMTPSFDTAGPLAVSAADCALVFEVLAGHDPDYLYSEQAPQLPTVADLEGLRIGLPRHFFGLVDAEQASGVRGAASALADLGAVVTEVGGPDPSNARQSFFPLLAAEFVHCYRDLWDDERVTETARATISFARQMLAADYYALWEEVLRWRRSFTELFEEVDVLLAPTTPYPAPRAAAEHVDVEGGTLDVHTGATAMLTIPANVGGLPALAFPVGFSSEGMPLSAQLVGPAWSELRLCSIVDHYQQTTDHHLQRPPNG